MKNPEHLNDLMLVYVNLRQTSQRQAFCDAWKALKPPPHFRPPQRYVIVTIAKCLGLDVRGRASTGFKIQELVSK